METSPKTGAKWLGDKVWSQLFMFQRKKGKKRERKPKSLVEGGLF